VPQIYYKGEAELMKGNAMEAARYLSLAAKLMPNDPFSYGNLAISLHQVTSRFFLWSKETL
jgi:Flp pilus assembly protein TadD